MVYRKILSNMKIIASPTKWHYEPVKVPSILGQWTTQFHWKYLSIRKSYFLRNPFSEILNSNSFRNFDCAHLSHRNYLKRGHRPALLQLKVSRGGVSVSLSSKLVSSSWSIEPNWLFAREPLRLNDSLAISNIVDWRRFRLLSATPTGSFSTKFFIDNQLTRFERHRGIGTLDTSGSRTSWPALSCGPSASKAFLSPLTRYVGVFPTVLST